MPQFRHGYAIGEENFSASAPVDITAQKGVNSKLVTKSWKSWVVENWDFSRGHVEGLLSRDLCTIRKMAPKLLD